jgi:O-methyltransferase involved in polyketide biosynthesis
LHLTGEKETLLITLYAKALDSRSKHSILGDRKADEMVSMIDYDFESLRDFGKGSVMVVRAKQLDEWVREFLRSNPDAVVLNLGCGLDTRVTRIGPSPRVSWFDVDYPDVIAERRKFYSEGEGYQMLESSVTEPGWLGKVPGGRPAMIVAEGLLEYLTEDVVRALLNRVTDHFPRGQIVFDVMNSFAIQSGKKKLRDRTGAEHRWAVDDVRDVDKLDSNLRRLSNESVLGSKYLPTGYRLTFGTVAVVPGVRNMMRLLRYEFDRLEDSSRGRPSFAFVREPTPLGWRPE